MKLRIACQVAMPWPMLIALSPAHRLLSLRCKVFAGTSWPRHAFSARSIVTPLPTRLRPLRLPGGPLLAQGCAAASRKPATSSSARRRRCAADSIRTALATVATSRGVRSTAATSSATAASSICGSTDKLARPAATASRPEIVAPVTTKRERPRVPHQFPQAGDTADRAGRRQLGVVRHNPQVAGQRHVESGTGRSPGDHRNRDQVRAAQPLGGSRGRVVVRVVRAIGRRTCEEVGRFRRAAPPAASPRSDCAQPRPALPKAPSCRRLATTRCRPARRACQRP